jgi:hypothetical protein
VRHQTPTWRSKQATIKLLSSNQHLFRLATTPGAHLAASTPLIPQFMLLILHTTLTALTLNPCHALSPQDTLPSARQSHLVAMACPVRPSQAGIQTAGADFVCVILGQSSAGPHKRGRLQRYIPSQGAVEMTEHVRCIESERSRLESRCATDQLC